MLEPVSHGAPCAKTSLGSTSVFSYCIHCVNGCIHKAGLQSWSTGRGVWPQLQRILQEAEKAEDTKLRLHSHQKRDWLC